MKKIILLLALLGYLTHTEGRLIVRNTEKMKITTITATDSSPVRLSRSVFEEDLISIDSRGDYSLENYRKDLEEEPYPIPNFKQNKRIPRQVKESSDKAKNVMNQKSLNITKKTNIKDKKPVLVKKPIPKFSDVDDDQIVTRSNQLILRSDTIEHEDEDFNLGDYDFDVNHDEFISGAKPLQPREKNKGPKPVLIPSDAVVVSKSAPKSKRFSSPLTYSKKAKSKKVKTKETLLNKNKNFRRESRSHGLDKKFAGLNEKPKKMPLSLPFFPSMPKRENETFNIKLMDQFFNTSTEITNQIVHLK